MLSALLEALDSRPKLTAAVAMVIATIAWWTAVVATAWTDEVFYVDPGACLALGRGFTSNGWSELGGGVTWGLSNPGVPLILAGWFGIFGFGQYQSHTFFFIIQVAGSLLIIRWAGRRWSLRPTEKLVILLIGLFLHSISGTTMYHARPDAFALLLYGWLLTFSFPDGKPGIPEIISSILFGIACVFLGLQFCGYFSLVAGLIFIWFRRRHLFIVGLGQAAGLALGVAFLWLSYSSVGTWDDFIAHRSDSLGRKFDLAKFVISKDFTVLIPALLAIMLHDFYRNRKWGSDVAKASLAALGLVIAIPLFINEIGIYQQPYSWMVSIAVLLVILPVIMRREYNQGGWFKWAIIILIIGSLAHRVSAVPAELRESSRRRDMLQELCKRMQPGDLTLGSMPFYYEIRGSGIRAVWTYDHRLPPGELAKKNLRWALITESDAKVVLGSLPGTWEQITSSDDSMARPYYGRYLMLRRKDIP